MNISIRMKYKYGGRPLALVVAGILLAMIHISDVTADQSGKEIVESRCTLCHELPDPATLTDEQWIVTLESMAGNAGLNDKEKAIVLGYLTSHEQKAIIITSMANEKRLFEKKCSLCHTTERVLLMPLTPESSRHIVMRMQKRAPDWISDTEVHEILEYLNHGAPEAVRPVRKPVDGGSAALFRERCTVCHSAERVYLMLQESEKKGTAMVWGHVVNRMREKAPEWITDEEAGQILQYLGSLKPVKEN